jgi:hypothetical protein
MTGRQPSSVCTLPSLLTFSPSHALILPRSRLLRWPPLHVPTFAHSHSRPATSAACGRRPGALRYCLRRSRTAVSRKRPQCARRAQQQGSRPLPTAGPSHNKPPPADEKTRQSSTIPTEPAPGPRRITDVNRNFPESPPTTKVPGPSHPAPFFLRFRSALYAMGSAEPCPSPRGIRCSGGRRRLLSMDRFCRRRL